MLFKIVAVVTESIDDEVTGDSAGVLTRGKICDFNLLRRSLEKETLLGQQPLLDVLCAKLSDNCFSAALLGTADLVLVEHTIDKFFGEGNGFGLNVWGQLLMIVRAYARTHRGQIQFSAPVVKSFLPEDGFFDPKEALRRAELDLILVERSVFWTDFPTEQDIRNNTDAVTAASDAVKDATEGWSGSNFLKRVQAHFKDLESPSE